MRHFYDLTGAPFPRKEWICHTSFPDLGGLVTLWPSVTKSNAEIESWAERLTLARSRKVITTPNGPDGTCSSFGLGDEKYLGWGEREKVAIHSGANGTTSLRSSNTISAWMHGPSCSQIKMSCAGCQGLELEGGS
jgi:hypothetical protein